jgi:acetylglutamate kinase
MNKDKITVIKIGGSTLGQQDTTIQDIVELQKQGYLLVVVHGGGKMISEWLSRGGAASKFINGERVTDQEALKTVTAVLSGLVNKELVASISHQGGKAIGISGVDGSLIQGKVKDAALGYVGAIEKVDRAPIEALMEAGYIPFISPIGLNTSNHKTNLPLLLNINADIVAGEVAASLKADKLIFLTDVEGIGDKSGQLIPYLSISEAEELIKSGVASGGMIPKINAGIRALSAARTVRIIDGRRPHALLQEIEDSRRGTTITAE